MKLFKTILPFLIGFLLILSFPFIGSEIINFFYGDNPNYHGKVETGANAHIYDAFAVLLVLFALIILIVSILFFRNKSLKISFANQALICAFLPILGYGFLITEIKNSKNLSIGLYLTLFRDDQVRLNRLLSIGANPNEIVQEKNPKGYSPLMIASGNGNIALVKQLVRAGASKDIKNIEGKTAEDVANERGHKDIADFLKDQK